MTDSMSFALPLSQFNQTIQFMGKKLSSEYQHQQVSSNIHRNISNLINKQFKFLTHSFR